MDNEGQVLLELEKLRGAVNEGFAKLVGRLDAGEQKTSSQGGEIQDLKREMKDLKAKVWRLTLLAAALGGGGGTAATQMLGG